MITPFLMVPIHLDALVLENEEFVLQAMADFSRLPYSDGRSDHNADVAYISESIVSPSFRDKSLRLQRGVHLHWALPDSLTRGVNTKDGLVFPVVPDRWLVTRSSRDGGPQEKQLAQKQWIVESDYLHPESDPQGKAPADTVSFPLPPRPEVEKWQPYRYLGRKWVVSEGRPVEESGAEYLNALVDDVTEKTNWHRVVGAGLTAIGYGEPAFAAFYPNCRSVFGLHDDEITGREQFKNVRYDVIGWYDQPEQRDCLRAATFKQTRAAIERRIRNEYEASGHEVKVKDPLEVWHEALAHHYGWVVSPNPGAIHSDGRDNGNPAEIPARFFCYAALTPGADANFEADPAVTSGTVDVAVGNTASEALSPYLAHRISGDKAVIEEQLEALDLGHRLEHRQLDIGPRFRETRHSKGFKSIRSGILWTVRLERDTSSAAANPAEPTVHTQTPGTLPKYLAHALNQLNEIQGAFQRAHEDISSLRQQIYQDWTLYMQALRPPEGLASGYPDPVEIARFIEKTGLTTLKRKLAATGNLTVQRETIGDQEGRDTPVAGACVPPHTDPHALASRLADCINAVIDGLKIANEVLDSLRRIDLAIAEAQKVGAEGLKSLEAALKSFLDERGIPYGNQDSVQTLRNRIHRQTEDLFNPARHKEFQEALAALVKQRSTGNSKQPEAAKMRYALRQVDAPRYNQPTDPVVLLAGEDLKPTQRHGRDGKDREDGKLECKIISDVDIPPVREWTNKVPEQLETIRASILNEMPDDDRIGARLWRHQPWNPFLMEWEAEMFPVSAGSNREEHRQSYATSFIAQNYTLPETGVDLTLKPGAGAGPRTADTGIYSGSCVLTDHAPDLLLDKLNRYLDKVAKLDDTKSEAVENIAKTLGNIRDFLAQRPYALSQALDGFHEALLQRHQILQLPIADPIGFEDMKPLTDAVREATQGRHSSSPLRGSDFTPIRSGKMKLRQLRLVDTFGRVKQVLDPDEKTPILTSEALRAPDAARDINLPPRLLQPARLNFRWLSAEHARGARMDEPESNAHPAFTPVCGWILTNNLDNSLMVYNNKGEALGTIIAGANRVQWQPAPGSELPRWEIEKAGSARINPHLRKLIDTIVNELGRQDSSFLDHFIGTLNSALENIAPEDFSHHESLALLMGRPIAVVRAMVNLELRGRPAANQSLGALMDDMLRAVDPKADAAGGQKRRAQFNLARTEKAAFLQALQERNPAGIRPAFEQRKISLPPLDSDIEITIEAMEGRDGRWRIHLPARSYFVRRDSDVIHVYLDTDRATDGFTHVRFPIRIGEFQQLNDGLVGYFLEQVDGEDYHYGDNIFYAPQAAVQEPLSPFDKASANVQELADRLDLGELPGAIADQLKHPSSATVTTDKTGQRWRIDTEGHVYTIVRGDTGLEVSEMLDSSSEHIRVHWKEPINLLQSIDDPPQKLTMLVDPQGSVHAVSGILPAKSIMIPTDQYAEALRKLEVTFLSTPILTERGTTRLPLAAEAGYQWSWLTRRGEAWSETAEIDRIDTRASFPGQQRIVEGWLKLRKEENP